ncbi:hypothetical protein ACFOM8_06020 [Paracoccus angustae]|uniref:Uncharacterized protein n=1 Tax=Paracoccus angustae TaxID=1671480 RepID=A0ABV7U233_9RHOB
MRILSRIKVNADTLADAIGAVALFAIVGAGLWILHGLGLSGL